MPVYTYRREDGTTFDIQQKFLDDPLVVCPTTEQKVIRVIHNPGVIFKGSGFYVTDNKNSKSGANGHKNGQGQGEKTETADSSSSENKPESKAETKAESKPETKTESKKEASTEKAS